MNPMVNFKFFIFLCCFFSYFQIGNAQSNNRINNPWKIDKIISQQNFTTQPLLPQKYQVVQLKTTELSTLLKSVPLRFTQEAYSKKVILAIPYPDGSIHNFQIVEAPTLHSDLGKQFPNIRSYEGIGLDDLTARLRFDWSPYGFHGMILSGQQETIFIEQYEKSDIESYSFLSPLE